MSPAKREPLTFSTDEEITFLTELLDAEQQRLLVGIRHTFHREYRDELHRRLAVIERVFQRVRPEA